MANDIKQELLAIQERLAQLEAKTPLDREEQQLKIKEQRLRIELQKLRATQVRDAMFSSM